MSSKTYPKFYRIILNSANAQYNNGDFTFQVNLPLFDSLNTKQGWLLGVESFYTSSTPAGISLNGQGAFANLHLRELTQITSYSSSRKASGDVLTTFNSAGYTNSFVTDSVAIPITDEQFFINKQITLYFSNSSLTRTVEAENTVFQVVLNLWHPDGY